jgi:hypothetical protein
LSDEYFVRWFEDEDVPYFVDGLNVDLWDEYNEDVFRWKFREDPFNLGFTSIAVVEHIPAGRPVAFNSFLPLQVRRGGDVFLAVQGCDGFVDREHRRRGLFQRTLRFLSEEIRGKAPEVLIGFNLLEAAGAAHKAGSELAYDLDKCLAEGEALGKFASRGGVELEPIGLVEYHRLYEEWAGHSQMLHFHRTLPYLVWRVERHPVRTHLPYHVLSDRETKGYVVVDLMEEHGGLTMTLNDYNPGLLEELLPGTLAALLETHTGATAVEFNAKNGSRLESLAEENGFRVMPWYTVIMMALNNTRQEGGAVYRGETEISDNRRWHVANGDIY